MPYIPSAEELEARGGGQFTLMGEDSYRVRVKELKLSTRPNPYEKSDEHPNGRPRETAALKLDVLSFEDGSALVDQDGNETSDRLFFDFIEVEKIGMVPKPSKARKFIAAALGQPVAQAIDFGDWQELVGKELIAHAIIKRNGKNGIDDYRPIPARLRNRRPSAPAPVELPGESIKKADDVDITAEAEKIFAGLTDEAESF
jgi:hypothetical protein